MKKQLFLSLSFSLFVLSLSAQKIDYELYELSNGLDVILHQDNSAPVVTVGVMYHVGAKDELPGRSGFAHFFEHLLFEGSKNIERGKWFDIVSANGGSNNANTSQDRTYYYETFPSNALELGLWMESERMLHPVINQIGVDTQIDVVLEEKKTRIDNAPYGKIIYSTAINKHLFKKHPYQIDVIGKVEDIEAAQLEDVKQFFELFYGPNNATLVIAGDFETNETKKMIEDYFDPVPAKAEVKRVNVVEDPITEKIVVTEYDNNIQLPLKIFVYRIPSMKERDSYVLNMISEILSGGRTSRLYKRMVDNDKTALQVLAFARPQEDYGTYTVGALPLGDNSLESLAATMDEEIERLKTELISEREYEKLQNTFLNRFVSSNSSIEGRASSLATYHTLYGNIDLINTEIEIYQSISRQDIMDVAKKYLDSNKRLEMEYLPQNDQ